MKTVAQGSLRKMCGKLATSVEYGFCVADQARINLNDYLNQSICLEYLGGIHCVQCGRKTSKSFQQGHCFPCMRKINECGNCRLFPERCRVEEGCCPTDDWAHTQCHADHTVYLANSSNLKVGITREDNPCARWIDQGAMQALPILTTSNRYQSGLVEVALKQFVGDKTNWRTMLKQDSVLVDILAEGRRILSEAEESLQPIFARYPNEVKYIETPQPIQINYPVIQYPEKVSSLSLDKTARVEGTLHGIKGQYLILDTGVINIRKFSGYNVKLSVCE
jgi:hypothetical protein